MLQAFVDDSKTGEEVLVLAGYISTFDQWARLSSEWHALLKGPPMWEEFKMARAIRHLAHAEKFYRLVEEYALASIVCVIEIQPLRRVCAELGLDKAALGNAFLTNPYNYAFKAIMGATYTEIMRNISAPLEFVFDDRGEKVHVWHAWDAFLHGLSPEERRVVASKPRFVKSHDCMPLQAAEIIAWHARKHWIKYRRFEDQIPLSWRPERPVLGHIVHWGYDEMKPNFIRTRETLIQRNIMLRPPFPITELTVTFSYDHGSTIYAAMELKV